jgi:hypothetical protein
VKEEEEVLDSGESVLRRELRQGELGQGQRRRSAPSRRRQGRHAPLQALAAAALRLMFVGLCVGAWLATVGEACAAGGAATPGSGARAAQMGGRPRQRVRQPHGAAVPGVRKQGLRPALCACRGGGERGRRRRWQVRRGDEERGLIFKK